MCTLNDVVNHMPPELFDAVHAATDITGFGLAGHSLNLACASHVSLHIDTSQLPRFERAMDLLGKGFLTKAHRTNSEYVKEHTRYDFEDTQLRQLVFDPQTSGGLLLSVDRAAAEKILRLLSRRFASTRQIGAVEPESEMALRFS